jgi:hypothetical protein
LVDVAENSVIVELTAKSSRVEAFLSLLRPFGILEAARSGESSCRSELDFEELIEMSRVHTYFLETWRSSTTTQDRWSCPEPRSLGTTMTTTSPPRSLRWTLRCCLPVKLRPVLRASSGDVERLCPACDGRHVKQKKWLGEMGGKEGSEPGHGEEERSKNLVLFVMILFFSARFHTIHIHLG